MPSPKPGRPRASDVVGPDVPAIVAAMRETIDTRPVRYTTDDLRAFVHDRVANRTRDRHAAEITVGTCRRWAAQFIDAQFQRDHHPCSQLENLDRAAVADDRRRRNK